MGEKDEKIDAQKKTKCKEKKGEKKMQKFRKVFAIFGISAEKRQILQEGGREVEYAENRKALVNVLIICVLFVFMNCGNICRILKV